MKTEDLKAQGLTEEQISYVMAENGKDIKKLQTQVERLTEEKAAETKRANEAETTLKGFEGIDPAKVQDEIASWKRKAEDAERDYQAKLDERDLNDKIKEAMEGIKFSSEAARRDVMRRIKEGGVSLKNGNLIGLNDVLGIIQKEDPSAFVDDSEDKAKRTMARFTAPIKSHGGDGGGKKMTKDEIFAIKDDAERRAAIVANMELFDKGE